MLFRPMTITAQTCDQLHIFDEYSLVVYLLARLGLYLGYDLFFIRFQAPGSALN